MFDGEEVRTESEQNEVRSGESIAERDEVTRVEGTSTGVPAEPGGEVIELEVINSCSQDVASKGGEENVVQATTTIATASSTALSMPSTYPSSVLIRSSSAAAPASLHKVQSFITV